MKISEMKLEELQDYALKLQEENGALKESEKEKNAKIEEITELNKSLQKRNNDLFMKVEQGIPESGEKEKEEKETTSCEDFARNLIKEGKF